MTNKIKGRQVELEIDSIGFEGVSIARKDGMVYFVKNAVPGDIVKAETIRKKKGYIETKAVEILKFSERRAEARCIHFGICGGCTWQNLEYAQQLKWKQQFVIDSFNRIGKLNVPDIRESLPSPKIYNYRNKMEFSFGASRWLTEEEISNEFEIANKHFALGLHISGRYDKVLDIRNCEIQPELGNLFLKIIREASNDFGLKAYHSRYHTGFLKNLIIRSNKYHSEFMIILITSAAQDDKEYKFLEWLKSEFLLITDNKITEKIKVGHSSDSDESATDKIVSIVHAINNTNNPVAVGRINFTEGLGYINEDILGIKYRISPFSFFQTNSEQLERLISVILEAAKINDNDIVWDLYCGTGSISLHAAKLAKYVFGFEMSGDAVSDARYNADINGIVNVKFTDVDLHDSNLNLLQSFSMEGRIDRILPDIIIIDPPRAGMHKNLVKIILQLNAQRIVYVSCNPATLARDCSSLSENYLVRFIQPVDMFPHTFHIESVAVLERHAG